MGKKILFVFRNLGTGGAQKIQAFVANSYKRKGYDVHALTFSRERLTVDLNESIPVEILDYDSVLNNQTDKFNALIEKGRFLLQLRNKIKKINPDLICVFLADVVNMVTLAVKGLNIPIIGSERGDPNQFNNRQLRAYNKAYNNCEAVVFQLQGAKEVYNIHHDISTYIIPNPCIPRKGTSFNEINEKVENSLTIMSAGRLVKQKRFDRLIKAFSIVYEKYPEYNLVIYGDGSERSSLEQLTNDAGLQGKVTLPGSIDDPFDNDNKPAIFVLSSDYEGIPNVLIEAMGSGIPSISTDCSPGGARFLLDSGRRGTIVPVEDYTKMADAIIDLIDNPSKAKEYIVKSKEIFDLFEPEKIEQQWLEVLENCLERK